MKGKDNLNNNDNQCKIITHTNKNNIRILIISDIHQESSKIDKLRKYCEYNKITYDYIFCMGDFDSLYIKEQQDDIIIEESIEIIKNILQLLETLCKRIFYIPGNHDPKILFSKNSPQLALYSQNIHKKIIEIEDNLLLIGIGGCIPNFYSDSEKNFHTFNYDLENINKNCIQYKGFPYCNDYKEINIIKSDEMYLNDIIEIFQEYEQMKYKNKQIIFLSHSGPIWSDSSNTFVNGRVKYCGSSNLQKFFNLNHEKFLLNIHGHTHKSVGLMSLFNLKIINPGSLLKGNFGEIILKKNKKKWETKNISFYKINYLMKFGKTNNEDSFSQSEEDKEEEEPEI